MNFIIHTWHTMLGMPKYDRKWHEQDLKDELAEYHEAVGLINKWSELSDIVYTYTRGHWSGHTTISFPFSSVQFFIGSLYMIPKYTLRWGFFRTLGKRFDKQLRISEVRNPLKFEKLKDIAHKYDLDPHQFSGEAQKLMSWWFLIR